MIRASALAAQALREYLLAQLPAQVATLNATRAATLTTAQSGPWTIPSGASIGISLTGSTGFTTVNLTSGSRTAAQLVTEINAAMGATVASALSDSRLRLTSTTAPSGADTASVVALDADTTDTLLALGFDPAGEMCVRAPLVAPTSKGICDGEPVGVIEPFAQGRMIVVIRDRSDVAITNELRREERLATLEVIVYVPMARQDFNRSREEIQAACECILDVISTTSGRYLGRSADGDVGFVQCKALKVSGSSFKLPSQNFLLDLANLTITARVFQRPTL